MASDKSVKLVDDVEKVLDKLIECRGKILGETVKKSMGELGKIYILV